MLFICYDKCSTCRKAKKWLDSRGISYIERPIKEENPTAAELKAWQQLSGQPVRKFVNTSGMLYRELQLKDKLLSMSKEEICQLLSTDGMLVKRPLLIGKILF